MYKFEASKAKWNQRTQTKAELYGDSVVTLTTIVFSFLSQLCDGKYSTCFYCFAEEPSSEGLMTCLQSCFTACFIFQVETLDFKVFWF